MKFTIDRFEGNFAVCEKEDGTMININRDKLPKKVKEGDILLVEDDSIKVDEKATKERKKSIDKLMEDLWEQE
ncbi:DUF3006 domain-containing protein [Schnuerera sp. xch1]|uniref:DUF3006 domain-containing protein n=1 Tax=Schnuerera sp. xch1 TaxID=2874283 RepID=UPI001CBF1199|nr:DUF3006 domain-containing protein [Schnuerera sp. xch1]MBZ2174548.1 DUF3006 domain-containing protein [Schnuerera sp. xch1]